MTSIEATKILRAVVLTGDVLQGIKNLSDYNVRVRLTDTATGLHTIFITTSNPTVSVRKLQVLWGTDNDKVAKAVAKILAGKADRVAKVCVEIGGQIAGLVASWL